MQARWNRNLQALLFVVSAGLGEGGRASLVTEAKGLTLGLKSCIIQPYSAGSAFRGNVMRVSIRVGVVFLALFTLAACGDPAVSRARGGSDAGEAATGSVGAECYPNGTCNTGLNCVAGFCDAPVAGESGGPCYPNGTCNGVLDCIDDRCEGGDADTGTGCNLFTGEGCEDTGADTGTEDTGTACNLFTGVGCEDTSDDTGIEDTGTADTSPVDTGFEDTGPADTGIDTTPAPTDEQFSGPYSYVWRIQLPQSGTDAECCFDFTDDGVTDNGIGTLIGALGAIAPDTDIQATLDSAVADGSTALLFEYAGLNPSSLSGPTQLWLYKVTNDLDGDGTPDQAWDPALRSGEGIFQVLPSSLAPDGSPLVRFASASVDSSFLGAGPGDFPFSFPFPGLLSLDVTIQQATLEADVRPEASGIFTMDADIDSDGDGTPEVWGGGKLGGLIPVEQVINILNDLANDCACAGIARDAVVILAGEGTDQYDVACDPNITINDAACTDADGTICGNLSTVCGFAPALPTLGLIDVDTNGNSIPDAISVGLRLSMSGAALANPPVAW